MGFEIEIDPDTGEVRGTSRRVTKKPPMPGLWKVICGDDGAVSVLGPTRQSDVGLLGSGTWTGRKIDNRYEPDDAINSKTWQHIAEAVYRAWHPDAEPAAGDVAAPPAAPSVPPPDALPPERAIAALDALDPSTGMAALDDALTAQPAPPPAPVEEPEPPRRTRDRRSGWWAFAAAGIAIVAATIGWIARQPGDTVALWTNIALTTIAAGLTLYGLIGLGTRCPSCKAWYRRDHTGTDELGTNTVTRQISRAVKDSSGKQIGTTYETATYEVTRLRYHYRCKECSHRWTGSGSRERRIS